MRSLRWIAVLLATLLPAQGMANTTPSFDNITLADYDKIVRELSANFAYSSVTPASSLGGLWGFEFGLVGGITKTPEIHTLVKRNNPNFKEDKFPHAGGLVRLGLPIGFTLEGMFLPTITVSDLKLSQYSGAVQWTFTDYLLSDFFFNMAVKGFYSKTKLSYKQNIQNASTLNQRVEARIDFDDTLYGAQFLVSKKLLVFEPYLGLGYIRANGELSVNAATLPGATIFAFGGNRAQAKPTSTQLMAGLDLRLAFFSLGAEYQKAFSTDSLTGRLSFRF